MRLWPGQTTRGWLGIDWGTRAIKFAQLERNGVGYRLRRKLTVRRSIPQGVKASAEATEWTTDDFPVGIVREGSIYCSKAACVLPMYLADVRSLELPDIPLASRAPIVASELADALSEGPNERVFDFWEITTGRNQRQTQVLSLKHSLATDVARAIGKAGPDCEVIDGLPFVLGRAIELALGPQNTPQIALDWGYTGVNLCVYRARVPIYCRQLKDCGVERMAAALGESIGVSTQEAEQLLTQTGLPGTAATSELQELTSQVTGDIIENLLEQLEKTLGYVDAEWPGVVGERIWLFGGGATIQHVDEHLSEKTGIEFRRWTLAGEDNARTTHTDVLFASAAALSALAWEQ